MAFASVSLYIIDLQGIINLFDIAALATKRLRPADGRV